MFDIKYQTISLTRGDSATLTVELVKANGKPYELQEGDELTLTVKKDANDAEAVIQLSAVDGVFTFAPSATDGLAFGKYRYDIQLETEAGEVYTPIVSDFNLTEEVTWSASS